MKCPKCDYSSFEYLNTCKKCGSDLTVHKTELGIDFPRAESLGIMAVIRQETSGISAEAAVAVVEEAEGGDMLSGTSGIEAAITADTDFKDLGAGIDLEEHGDLDLSGLGESSDETASISLPSIDEEEISLGDEETAPIAEKEEEFSLDLSGLEETAPASGAVEEPKADEMDLGEFDLSEPEASSGDISGIEAGDLPVGDESTGSQLEGALGLGEEEETVVPSAEPAGLDDISLDLGGEEIAGEPSEAEKVEDAGLDLGDMDLDAHAEVSAETAKEEPSASADLDGLNLDLDLSDLDLDQPAVEPEKKEGKEKKKEEDIDDLGINLDDLKLE
ncbi:hypothetical protein HZB08_02070 [Candidatus Saganbacteria bacterium]|uniref:Uncharacterized protein n=1 Tax=Candidatus Saganbacteria bacterium TaxID=2575572 RepID=A0A9D6UMC0_UNCSA|nr:hypothetical protein [Candidatus Saganbacteria bacterium]